MVGEAVHSYLSTAGTMNKNKIVLLGIAGWAAVANRENLCSQTVNLFISSLISHLTSSWAIFCACSVTAAATQTLDYLSHICKPMNLNYQADIPLFL